MIAVYVVLSAVITLLLEKFYGIMQNPNSFWIVPLIFIGIFFAFFILHALIVLGMIFTVNLKKQPKGTKFFRFLVKTGLPFLLRLARVKFETQGLDKIPTGTRMLVVCNHQHNFDPVVIVNFFPDSELSFIGKKEILTTMPFAARAMHMLECLYIDRENDREAAKTVIQAIKRIKEDKNSIGLFPEGYVSKTCELQPLRNGSLKIAMKSNAPVVVCVLNGTRVMAKSLFIKRSRVQFRVLDVISPEEYKDMNTSQLGDIIHDKMDKALKEIRG